MDYNWGLFMLSMMTMITMIAGLFVKIIFDYYRVIKYSQRH